MDARRAEGLRGHEPLRHPEPRKDDEVHGRDPAAADDVRSDGELGLNARRSDSRRLGGTARPSGLVPVPQELTFEDYRIYAPPEVRDAFGAMAAAAATDSISLQADSGFRSLGFQRRIMKRRLASGDSFDKVLLSVAPPGYSEHHTGRALDLCPSEANFAFTATYDWLRENAARFGFYETLPEDPAAPLTWESWHWTWSPPSD